MKYLYIILGLVLFSGCSIVEEITKDNDTIDSEEELKNEISLMNKSINEEIELCIIKKYNNPLNYYMYPFKPILEDYYKECRYKSEEFNFTKQSLNYSCDKLKVFIDIDYFPTVAKSCYDERHIDILTGETKIDKNICPEIIYDLPHSYTLNTYQTRHFKEQYINRCVDLEVNNK